MSEQRQTNSSIFSMVERQEGLASKTPKKRTKSGCLTCRKRRIKCDEEKPICRNCSKTKRPCDQPRVPVALARTRSVKNELESSSSVDETGLSLQPRTVQSSPSSRNDRSEFRSRPAHQNYPQSYGSSRSQGSANSPVYSYESILPFQEQSLAAEDDTTVDAHSHFEPYSVRTGTIEGPYIDHMPFSSLPETSAFLPYGESPLTSPTIFRPSESEYFPHDGDAFDHAGPGHGYQSETAIQQIQQAHQELSNRHGSRQVSARGSYDGMDRSVSRPPNPRKKEPMRKSQTSHDKSEPAAPSIVLTPRQERYLQHFIHNVNMNFTSLDEVAVRDSRHPDIQSSNFWTFVIPSLAIRSEPLLHAVLAISALHESNIQNKSEHQALLDYHQAIRKLAEALIEPGAAERDDLLAACLILAYFETMAGEMVKWGRHLQGACDIVRSRIESNFTTNHEGEYTFTARPTISDHLIWFFVHQDTVQSVLSGNGLFLDLAYVEMCPVRGLPGSVTHTSDQLRVLLARIGHFVAMDRGRKEAAAAMVAASEGHNGRTVNDDALALLKAAISQWEDLMSTLVGWRTELSPIYDSAVVDSVRTPFGSVVVYKHPAIASFQIMSLAAIVHLHRAHPTLSHVPAEAVREAAAATYIIGLDIVKILSGIMVEGVNNRTIDTGAHVKAMINAVLPAFLAGIGIREERQRDYLERLMQDVYTFTGWRAAIRVLQGFDVAWQRKRRPDDRLPSLDDDPNVEREQVQVVGKGVVVGEDGRGDLPRYVVMDKAETLNAAAGVLGKLKVVSSVTEIRARPRTNDIGGREQEPRVMADGSLLQHQQYSDMSLGGHGDTHAYGGPTTTMLGLATRSESDLGGPGAVEYFPDEDVAIERSGASNHMFFGAFNLPPHAFSTATVPPMQKRYEWT